MSPVVAGRDGTASVVMPSDSRAIVVVVVVVLVVVVVVEVVVVVVVVVVDVAGIVVGVAITIGSSAAQLVAHAANTIAKVVDRMVCFNLIKHLSCLGCGQIFRSRRVIWIWFFGSSSPPTI